MSLTTMPQADEELGAVRLNDALRAALDDLHIDRDRRTVTVGDHRIDDSAGRLQARLGTELYRAWHSGAESTGEVDVRRDLRFEEQLRDATPHRSSRTAATVRSAVIGGQHGQHVLFDVGRVRVQLLASECPDPLPQVGSQTWIDLPAIRPALSPGFFLINGSAGSGTGADVLRVYLHVDEPAMAATVWHNVTQLLEDAGVPYRAKALAKPTSYPRRDAMVIYLDRPHVGVVPGVVACVRDLPGRGMPTSLLAQSLAGGVSVAWEPKDYKLGWTRMSFGQHRTAVVASAVVQHLDHGAELYTAVADALVEHNVDPLHPFRNCDSPAVDALGLVGQDAS